MKIAIDSRSLESQRTGVGRYLSNLLRYWRHSKEHKFILYFKDRIPENDLVKSDNFTLKLIKNPFGFSSNFFFQHFLLPHNIRKDKVDFFFSPFYLKPFYCPVKSCISLHDISYEAHPEWFDPVNRIILGKLSKLSAKTADLIFTVSYFSKGEIMKYYGVNSSKIVVTHLAVDEDFTKTSDVKRAEAVKKKYGIIAKFALCVGSVFNRRHIPEVIRAFEKIARKYQDYQLLIIGKNYTYPFLDIEKQIGAVNNNLKRNAIIRLDFVEDRDLQALYTLCEFAIYLSDYEGFGLPVIEAQFFEKPVVTSYNSSLREVGDNSVEFVKKNTVDEIYNSLEKVVSDDSYRLDLIRRGRENIKRFSWKKCAWRTLENIVGIS